MATPVISRVVVCKSADSSPRLSDLESDLKVVSASPLAISTSYKPALINVSYLRKTRILRRISDRIMMATVSS